MNESEFIVKAIKKINVVNFKNYYDHLNNISSIYEKFFRFYRIFGNCKKIFPMLTIEDLLIINNKILHWYNFIYQCYHCRPGIQLMTFETQDDPFECVIQGRCGSCRKEVDFKYKSRGDSLLHPHINCSRVGGYELGQWPKVKAISEKKAKKKIEFFIRQYLNNKRKDSPSTLIGQMRRI